MGSQFAELDWGGLLHARAHMYIVVVAEMAAKEARLRWGSYLTSIEIPRHEERDEKCKRYLDAAGSLGKSRQV